MKKVEKTGKQPFKPPSVETVWGVFEGSTDNFQQKKKSREIVPTKKVRGVKNSEFLKVCSW